MRPPHARPGKNLTPWPPLRDETSPPTPLRQAERGVLVALALLLTACVVDTGVPADARLICAVDDDCPGGWRCLDDLCRPEGWAPDAVEPDLAADGQDEAGADAALPRIEDRLTICGALYDKIEACPAEVKATLGQAVWDLVGDDRAVFASTTCARELLEDATDQDLDDYLVQVALLGSITCPMFVSVLCELFPDDAGYETACP